MSGLPNIMVVSVPHNRTSDNSLETTRNLQECDDTPYPSSSASIVVNSILPRPICKYFQLGTCNKGNQCHFVHSVSSNTAFAASNMSSHINNSNVEITSDMKTDCATSKISETWVNAAEFIPKASHPPAKSCAQAINSQVKSEHDGQTTSFSAARSREMTCGICFEIVMDKPDCEQRFGILPNCNHCFCLTCIRKWRQAKQFDNKIIRACPECRVTSDYVCPSVYWVDAKDGKDKLLTDYKHALSLKHCKYFKQGSAKCPFGNKCFYLHALPDGTKTDVGPPQRQRRHNRDAEIDMLQQIVLLDFLEDEDRWFYSIDEMDFFSETEDSDRSEYDLFFD